jgi:pyruvate,water dikinase
VAERIRKDPATAKTLRETDPRALARTFLDGQLPAPAQGALADFLDAYGMRGLGEIDIGRPRWSDDPTPLLRTLQSYLSIADGDQAPDATFARSAAAAEATVPAFLAAMQAGPTGPLRARLARAAIRRMRALMGLRESPKFLMVRLMAIMRQALLESGSKLVVAGQLQVADDLFYLRLDELRALAHGVRRDWQAIVAQRRAIYAEEQKRAQIPRLFLSDGETFYDSSPMSPADSSIGQLRGDPVSPGVVTGHVRVLFDPAGAQLLPGEILVCPGTDPAWTPLFLSAGGLITEVGGLMTHGSVVAREYGIPAVVGVERATRMLHTGQRIRLDGTSGRIQLLDKQDA